MWRWGTAKLRVATADVQFQADLRLVTSAALESSVNIVSAATAAEAASPQRVEPLLWNAYAQKPLP